MQRRKVDGTSNGADSGLGSGSGSSKATVGARRAPRRSRGSAFNPIIFIMVAAMILFGTALFFFPSQVHDVEAKTAQETKKFVDNAYQMEQEMEKQMGDFWHHQVPMPEHDNDERDPTAAMKRQSSSWVDGEKKLKEKLRVLYERQQKGLDLGVPVLTRYLGEDIPAWVGEGVDEAEWRKKVEERYKEMAKEEQQWRESMKWIDERNTATSR